MDDALVASYLAQYQRLKIMRATVTTEQKKLTSIEKELKIVLQATDTGSIPGVDGTGSTVVLAKANRREYISRNTLAKLLENFFLAKFSDTQSPDAISQIASDAALFVWSNRTVIELTTVKLSTNKRKRTVT